MYLLNYLFIIYLSDYCLLIYYLSKTQTHRTKELEMIWEIILLTSYFLFCFVLVLGIEWEASHLPDKNTTIKPYLQPLNLLLYFPEKESDLPKVRNPFIGSFQVELPKLI